MEFWKTPYRHGFHNVFAPKETYLFISSSFFFSMYILKGPFAGDTSGNRFTKKNGNRDRNCNSKHNNYRIAKDTITSLSQCLPLSWLHSLTPGPRPVSRTAAVPPVSAGPAPWCFQGHCLKSWPCTPTVGGGALNKHSPGEETGK